MKSGSPRQDPSGLPKKTFKVDPVQRIRSEQRSPLRSPEAMAVATDAVAPLPRAADGEPVFAEPWQAKAFAMTLELYERGLFTWPEWAATLGAEIKRAQAAGDPALSSLRHGQHGCARQRRSGDPGRGPRTENGADFLDHDDLLIEWAAR